jgi:P27 family predicted phage terminase small subunit
MLDPPSWLTKDQRRIFESFQDLIIEQEIAQVTDKFAAHMLCIQFAQYLDVCEQIAIEGFMIETINKDGIPNRRGNPLLVERARLFTSAKTLAVEFGLTPRNRQKVLEEAAEASPIFEEVDPEEVEWDELLG